MTLPINNDDFLSLSKTMLLFSCVLVLAVMRIVFLQGRCLLQVLDKSDVHLGKTRSTPGSLRMFTLN